MSLLRRFRAHVLVTSRIYLRTVEPPSRNQRHASVSVRPATLADVDVMQQLYPAEFPARKAEFVRARIESPAFEALVSVDAAGVPTGFAHLEWDRVRDEHLGIELGTRPGVALFFDDFVFSAHRGEGLHRAQIAARIDRAGARGARAAAVIIEDSNAASLRNYLAEGFEPAGRAITLRIHRWRRSGVLRRHRVGAQINAAAS